MLTKSVRKFIPYDQDTIFKEMDDLPEDDFIALKHAMGKYARSDGGEILPPATAEDQHKYGAKYKPMYVLLVYEKEKDEAPRHLVEAAYQRMLKHKEKLDGLA